MTLPATPGAGAERWRRIEEVCQSALALDRGERSTFLAAACAGDDALRREVETLLAHEQSADAFLGYPVAALAANIMGSGSGASLVGRHIGSYQLVAPLGVGGMGEVYRARDSKLGRDVAIKVLPSAFTADRERLARFEREARLLAALSHPHIGAIYGLEEAGDIRALVLELVEGETLEARLKARPPSVAEALATAVQIAEALDHAHRRGVTHRDLKPSNIMLTKGGAKLLDFGLAKWTRPPNAAAGWSSSTMPAEAGSLTEEGTILGTVHYMAPEQLEGREVDARSDVFAFGAVLYEMVTGRKAFKGASRARVIAAILTSSPPLPSTLEPLIPTRIDRIVAKCLAKDPDARWQSARDLADELKWLSEDVTRSGASSSDRSPAGLTSTAISTTRRRRSVGVVVAAALAVAAVVGVAAWRVATSSPQTAVFRQVTFRNGHLDTARFTSDGQNIIYTASWETAAPEIFSVPANQSGGRAFDIKNARLLAVSRNGELAVALAPTPITSFLAPGTLARGSMAGNAPKAEIEQVAAADYGPDGRSLAIVRYVPEQRICQVEYPVGTVLFRGTLLTDLRFSPDGKYLAFIAHDTSGDDRGMAVVLRATGENVVTGQPRDSLRGLVWNPSGNEIWLTSPYVDGSLVALDLKGGTRELLNVPGRLLLRDALADGRVLLDQGIVRRGMIAVTGRGESQRDLSWLNYSYVRGISNDGQMVVFDEEGRAAEGYRTFVRNVDSGAAIDVGPGYGIAISDDKAWTLSVRPGEPGELWLRPVGAGQSRRLSPPDWRLTLEARFFADGKRIAFVASEPNRRLRSYVQSLDGGAPRAISAEGVFGALISPDQKWIAATSPAGPVLVPIEGRSTQPVHGVQPDDVLRGWTSDGQFYVANRNPTLLRIDTLNPWTGKRTLWREMRAPAIVGLRTVPPFITPDGRTYVYGYALGFSDLFVMTGVH